MTGAEKLPSRVVDADNQGWYLTAKVDGDGNVTGSEYQAKRGLEGRQLADIERERGPIRPVLPITDEDEQLIRATFDRIGRKSIATLAAAIEQVFHDARERRGGLNNVHDSYEYAQRTLTAGREGSWESTVLLRVQLLGNGLNLVRAKRGEDSSVEAMRKRGPSKRVDVDGRQVLADMLTRWTSSPDRYTEVADTLASVVSRYADEVGGADGWRKVADQYLQPGALAVEDFHNCYHLFYSQSDHFDSGLL